MLQNYLLITLRNLRGQGFYAFLNIFGLSVGIASCLLIVLYIFDELRYDDFHAEADRLYRVTVYDRAGSSEIETALTAPALAPIIPQEFASVRLTTRFMPSSQQVLRWENQSATQSGLVYVDEDFFRMFSYPLRQGDPATALKEPNSLILTESTARKYFGNASALGKLINIGDDATYEVTGIVADPPDHSHLYFEVLASFSTLPSEVNDNWTSYELYTYLLLADGSTSQNTEEELNSLIEKYIAAKMYEDNGADYSEESGNEYRISLQAVPDIHLHSNLFGEFIPGGNVTTLYVLGVIAFFILMIACVNFMNLATARYMRRAREVGVRKTLGSTRRALIGQFLSEATIMSFLAMVLAMIWAIFVLPSFNTLTGKELTYDIFTQSWLVTGLVVLVFTTGLLAGSYPAFFLSGFRPTEVLKGGRVVRRGNVSIRNMLVVFQFAVSIGLIICTILAYQQIAYTRHKDLGFDKEQVMALSYFDLLGEKAIAVKQAVTKRAVVEDASLVSGVIPQTYVGTNFWKKGSTQQHLLYWYTGDHDHLSTMGIELAAGRNFSTDFSADSLGVLLNETAVRNLELEDPIGSEISYDDSDVGTYRVLGVIKDFNFQSLHYDIEPMAIFLDETGSFLLVRFAPDNVVQALEEIEEVWHKYAADIPFEYTFMNEEFDRKFRAEQQLSGVFTVFSILAVVVAVLGLLGLAAYAAEQRTKEIGVRKALGASTGNVVWLLSKDFTRLVVLAFLVSVPIAYFLMKSWLDQFAFRVEVGVLPFILAGAGALLIAWLTVGILAFRATQTNPADVLRID
jgi:putative ABC transport system permease protein